MSTSKEQQRHDDYWDRWDAAVERSGLVPAGPDHPVYRDKSITIRSAHIHPNGRRSDEKEMSDN